MSLFLAYDGSLNGDWIANYALHMAAGAAERRIEIVHVEDANVSGAPLHGRIERIASRAERLGVAADIRILPMHDGVQGGLLDYLPPGPETLVICGARAESGRRGVLTGTISERLLRQGRFNVMSIRVLQPGLLGNPRRVLLALPDRDDAADAALPFLKPMTPIIDRLVLLSVALVSHRQFRNLTDADAARLRHEARGRIALAENAIARGTGIALDKMDNDVRVSDDWPKQVAVEAGRQKSGLVMAEVREADLARFSFAHPMEELMRIAPCDIAAFRSYVE